MFISNNLNNVSNKSVTQVTQRQTSTVDSSTDTMDLYNELFDFENLKRNSLNNMLSWSFLKKLSDFNQWPIGCIGNLVENSIKDEVSSKNISIEVQAYDKKVYSKISSVSNNESLTNNLDFTGKNLVLSIIDDGRGMNIKEFNQNMFSFSINEKKEHNFMRYGVSMKTSAIRLANALFIISKTETDLSIGLLSKDLQIKMDTDFILTPIVNYKIDIADENEKKYIPRSDYSKQSLNLIMNEIKFMFNNSDDLFSYIDSFQTGTHIFLYDLKQISSDKNRYNKLDNYELLVDFDEKDILFNYFNIQISDRNAIDCSLVNYLKFLFLKHSNINVTLLKQKINLINPLLGIYNITKNTPEAVKVSSKLTSDEKKCDCVYVEGEIYKGVVFNDNYFNLLTQSYNFENTIKEREIFNGVLLYRNNRLISRYDQSKFGDICYFVKKSEKLATNEIGTFFPISGFLELPPSLHETLYNKAVKLYFKKF